MITLKRGDSRTLRIEDFLQPDGTTPYLLVVTDVVKFTIKRQDGMTAILTKQSGGSGITFTPGTDYAIVTIAAADLATVTPGSYVCDAEVTHADDTKTTVASEQCIITSDIS